MSLSIKPLITDLCRSNAYWMARLAKEAYQTISEDDPSPNEDAILSCLKDDDPKFIKVSGFNQNTAQAIFVEHEDYVCMAFRGTDEKRDWLDNINAFPTAELFGKFHRGFWRSTNDVWEGIWSAYQQSRGTPIRGTQYRRPLFITGHSLGGAMATLAAAKLIHMDRPFNNVYTFGQPRTMSREASYIFNGECSSRFFRFHNDNDLVTRLPGRVMGYSHVGKSMYIAEDAMIHKDSFFWLRFLDSIEVVKDVVGDFREGGIMGGIDGVIDAVSDCIADHNIDRYVDAIEKWHTAWETGEKGEKA